MSKAIVIIGPKRSGKTTFRRALSEAMQIPFGDTGDVILEKLLHQHDRLEQLGVEAPDVYKLGKESLRPHLIAMGDALCLNDPTCLIRAACGDSPVSVVAGVRRIEELNAARETGLVEVVYWIGREGNPDSDGMDNLTIGINDADRILDNQGSIDQLKTFARRVAREHNGST